MKLEDMLMKLYESVYKKIEEDIKSGFYKEGENCLR